jgi:CubicO group peptidase (beta-lactamase class C family)
VLDAAFEEAARAARERHGVPAVAVGVLDAGRVTEGGFGCAPDDVFRVASVTKPFTATVAAALLDPGDLVEEWPGVRVSHLLSHTSGYDSECGDLLRFGEGDDALELAAAALAEMRPRVAPGELWAYANSGYWLAGCLAARRNASTYEEAVAEHILEPLGLASTSFGGGRSLPGHEAAVDGSPARPVEGGRYPRARRPGGGLESNVQDLLRFARWQLEEPWTQMLREPVVTMPGGSFGLGFAVETVGGHAVWGHRGSNGGFESSLLLVPERGLGFAGLTNAGNGSLVLRALEDELFERALGARRPVPAPVDLPRSALELLAGRYVHPELEADIAVAPGGAGLLLEVVETDARTGRPGAAIRALARPIGAREFAVAGGPRDGSRFDFVPAEDAPRFVRLFSRLAERAA